MDAPVEDGGPHGPIRRCKRGYILTMDNRTPIGHAAFGGFGGICVEDASADGLDTLQRGRCVGWCAHRSTEHTQTENPCRHQPLSKIGSTHLAQQREEAVLQLHRDTLKRLPGA
eukprot:4082278-Pyramimonas_sp.AAC.2